jgi:poly-gamma-glutamate synthesis protein (capsule biosynthesis protein)
MPGELLPLVERARADHDLVVVVVHWGEEYFAAPSLRQRRVARRLLDGGVDMIIGHHPHVLQAIERHETGLVAYSLGNFLFSHTTSLPRLMGVLRTVWRAAPQGAALADSCLVEAVLHPVINDPTPHPHPSPATGEPAEQVRHRIVGLSRRLGTRWKPVEGTEDLRLEGEAGCGRPRSTGAEPGRAPASRSSAPPSRGG